MTRHGKNNTASPCYTYHERQRDTSYSGYGTQRLRLGKDSVKDFDACSLTLQPCRQPVITPLGILYEREAVLEYIIQKKSDAIRKLKEYERQTKREARELQELADAEQRSKTERFLKLEKGITSSSREAPASGESKQAPVEASASSADAAAYGTVALVQASGSAGPSGSSGSSASVSNMTDDRRKQLPSFWIPSMTPQSAKTRLKRPSGEVFCPITGQPLKAKDLLPVSFTPIDKSDTGGGPTFRHKDRYMCPVTGDVLSNAIQCAALRTSGTVVTMECVEKFIRKDMLDPINGKQMTDEDIIAIQRGGTGYAVTNRLVAEIKKPVMQA